MMNFIRDQLNKYPWILKRYLDFRVYISRLITKVHPLFQEVHKQLVVKKNKSQSALVFKNNNDIFLYQSSKNYELFNPNLLRILSVLFLIIFFSFIALAAVTNIKEATIAKGVIEPQKNIIHLEHFDGGVVTAIYVAEGDSVKEGDVLLTLDGIGAKEDLARFVAKNLTLKLQAERLKSILNHTDPDFSQYTKDKQVISEQLKLYHDMIDAAQSEKAIINQQLSQQEFNLKSLLSKKDYYANQIKIAEQILAMYKNLEVKGNAPKVKLLEEQERLLSLNNDAQANAFEIKKVEQVVEEYKSKLLSYDATQENNINQTREKIGEEINENNEQITKLGQKDARRNLRSPVDGIINARYVNDIGESIYPDKKLFEIVPFESPLIASLQISPDDIGHVKAGDLVWIKVSAFDYIKYGLIKGKLYHLSAGTFTDDKEGKPYYRGKVRLEHNYVMVKNQKKYLMPGMLIKAEVITGERTIMEYLLKPIYRSIDGGLVER